MALPMNPAPPFVEPVAALVETGARGGPARGKPLP
jgi:hypothetical protein